MDTFVESLHKLLQPMFYADAENNNSLETYTAGLGELFELIEFYASDTDEIPPKPGYSLWIDLDRAPDIVLPWLGQFVGVTVTQGISAEDQRNQIRELGVWGRGTVRSIQAAPVPYLKGAKAVTIVERDTSAYHFKVTINRADLDPANDGLVLRALLAAKPAGLVMNLIIYSGQKAFTIGQSALRGTPADAIRLAL